MDIDEFLDRELSDLALGDKTEMPKLPQYKRSFGLAVEPSALLHDAKTDLSKGDISLAKQSYFKLLDILFHQNLKWNQELYDQLLALSKQFSIALEQSYNNAKKKMDNAYGLINRAKTALQNGEKDTLNKIYLEIQEINNLIPSMFFEEKKAIEDQIMDLYYQIRNIMHSEQEKRASSLLQEINSLIEMINVSIGRNDTQNAVINYSKCVELYNQIPESFLWHKNSAGIRILEIYKTLSIDTEIANLQRQLNGERVRISPPTHSPDLNENYKEIASPIPDINKKKELLNKKNELLEKLLEKKEELLSKNKELARDNIKKGFYNEAWNDIEEALKVEPNDVESKALRAKIKTLQ